MESQTSPPTSTHHTSPPFSQKGGAGGVWSAHGTSVFTLFLFSSNPDCIFKPASEFDGGARQHLYSPLPRNRWLCVLAARTRAFEFRRVSFHTSRLLQSFLAEIFGRRGAVIPRGIRFRRPFFPLQNTKGGIPYNGTFCPLSFWASKKKVDPTYSSNNGTTQSPPFSNKGGAGGVTLLRQLIFPRRIP